MEPDPLSILSRIEDLLEEQRDLLQVLSDGYAPSSGMASEHDGLVSELRAIKNTIGNEVSALVPLLFPGIGAIVVLLVVIAWRVW